MSLRLIWVSQYQRGRSKRSECELAGLCRRKIPFGLCFTVGEKKEDSFVRKILEKSWGEVS